MLVNAFRDQHLRKTYRALQNGHWHLPFSIAKGENPGRFATLGNTHYSDVPNTLSRLP